MWSESRAARANCRVSLSGVLIWVLKVLEISLSNDLR